MGSGGALQTLRGIGGESPARCVDASESSAGSDVRRIAGLWDSGVGIYVTSGALTGATLVLHLGYGVLWDGSAFAAMFFGLLVYGECSFVPRGERLWDRNRSSRG